jgi:hypothetical protein
MAGIAICNDDGKCPHSKECFRFIDKTGELMNLKEICNEANNYELLWKIETNIIKKEDEK